MTRHCVIYYFSMWFFKWESQNTKNWRECEICASFTIFVIVIMIRALLVASVLFYFCFCFSFVADINVDGNGDDAVEQNSEHSNERDNDDAVHHFNELPFRMLQTFNTIFRLHYNRTLTIESYTHLSTLERITLYTEYIQLAVCVLSFVCALLRV